nr:MAG TPA: DNA pilot protein VP2 [Microviridae sp.]
MPLPLIAAGIAGAASLIGAGINYLGSRQAQTSNSDMLTRQLNHSDTAATLAYQRQQDLIDKQNLYNSPVQQMERLKAAELNPYLMYNQGGATLASSTANVQQANTPSVTYQPNYLQGVGDSISSGGSELLANIINFKRLENESKLADAQSKSLLAQAGLSESTTRYQDATLESRVALQKYEAMFRAAQISDTEQSALLKRAETEFYHWRKDNMSASTAQINAQKEYITTQISAQRILNKYLDKQQSAQLSKTLGEARKAYVEGDYIKVQTSLADFNAQTQRILAIAAKQNANANTYNAATERYRTHENVSLGLQRNEIDKDKAKTLNEATTKVTQKDLYNTISQLLSRILGDAATSDNKSPMSIVGFNP